MEREYELKLAKGKAVKWNGTDGVDAAKRYVDCHREATVTAWREANRTNIVVTGVNPRQIIG
ncbi:hypothetical protein LCGC14_2468680 [marine sediment metagenome]|uniref:Uncharacterized protein n=1 Tax=marine sediment metagenome TaxID=412755 RepID=A0A0F9DN55_9ZZZZ